MRPKQKSSKQKYDERKAKQKKSIMIYGATASKSTGNSKLIYNMAKAFQSAGHIVSTIGMEYNDVQIWHDNIPILPAFKCEQCGNMNKGSNIQKIANWMNFFTPRPQYFICVGDPYMFQQHNLGKLEFKEIKSLMYATFDSEGIFCNQDLLTQNIPDHIDNCDRIISTAEFTQKQFKEWHDLDTDMIYETIDLNNYKLVSLEEKITIRKKYRFKEDDFIIYYVGRNILRKRVFELLDATAKFLCETKNTYLYLNIPAEAWYEKDGQDTPIYSDGLNPWDFIKRVLKKRYGRDLLDEGRIMFVQRGGLGSTDVSEASMAELYQLSDVYACTTGGEGFGLPPAESMACGVPAIVPDNSTGKEIIGDKAGIENSYFIEGKGGLITKTPIESFVDWGLKQKLTTPENTYQAIKHLYDNPELRKKLGGQGRKHVEEKFNFETFKDKWLDVIKTTEKKKAPAEEFKTMKIGEGKNEAKNS